jgi:hypothetical protein
MHLTTPHLSSQLPSVAGRDIPFCRSTNRRGWQCRELTVLLSSHKRLCLVTWHVNRHMTRKRIRKMAPKRRTASIVRLHRVTVTLSRSGAVQFAAKIAALFHLLSVDGVCVLSLVSSSSSSSPLVLRRDPRTNTFSTTDRCRPVISLRHHYAPSFPFFRPLITVRPRYGEAPPVILIFSSLSCQPPPLTRNKP